MPKLPDWIVVDGLPADIAGLVEQLGGYAEFAHHWRKLATALWQAGVDAPVDSPVRLALYLSAKLDSDEVVAVFDGLGLSEMRKRIAGWRAEIADPDKPWAKLLRPCTDFVESYGIEPTSGSFARDDGDNPGLVSLTMPHQDGRGAAAGGAATLSFALGGDAALECEAGSVWPFRGDGVPPGLVRIGGKGAAKAQASVAVPFAPIGDAGVHAGITGDASLEFYFRPEEPDAPFAEALLGGIGAIPNPLDLSDIAHAMTLAGLEGLVLGCAGSAEAGLSVILGKDVEVPEILSGRVGLDATLDFRRQARWLLSLRREGGAMRFVLSREIKREREWAAGVGVELDWSGLARRAHDLVAQADGLQGEALATIAPFLSPGTYLRDRALELVRPMASSLLEFPDFTDAVTRDLEIASGARAGDRSALVDWLGDQLSDLAATHADGVLADAAAWAKTIVSGLAKKAPALVAPALEAAVAARIQPTLEMVKTRFENTLAAVLQSPDVSKKLAEELKRGGIALAALNNPTASLDRGVRDIFAKVSGFAQKVLAATGEGVEKKLSARFGWSGSDSRGTHYELVGTFAEATPETAALWRALVTGQLQPFQRILAAPASAPQGLVLDPASSLSRLAGTSRGFALELIVAGLEVSVSSIVEGKAQVTVNANGDISVFAEGRASRDVDGIDEGRSATFVSTWDLLLSKFEGERSHRTMMVNLALDHEDKDLSVSEVTGFLSGLGENRLVQSSRLARAEEIYQQWRLAVQPGKKVRGAIGVRMALGARSIERMVAIGRRLPGDPSLEMAVFAAATRQQLAAGISDSKDFDRDVREARRKLRLEQARPFEVFFAMRDQDFESSGSALGGRYRYSAFAQLLPRSMAFIEILVRMAQIYDAIPIFGAPAASGWGPRDYAKAEKAMAKAARRWLKLNQKFIFFFKAKMHPAVIGLFTLLATMETPLENEDPVRVLDASPDPDVANRMIAIVMTPRHGEAVAV